MKRHITSVMSRRDVVHLSIRVELLKHIDEQIPGFTLRQKSNSSFMKVLSFLLFFNKKFMTHYTTTIYPVVYVPDFWGKYKSYGSLEHEILAHEYVHMYDRKRLGWLFNILYLSPQVFALFALGAFWNPWFLLSLIFLLPWPSPGRAWLEFRGYRMSIAYQYWTKHKKCDIYRVVEYFTGPNYYYMFPFKKLLEKWFNKELEKIKKDELSSELVEIKQVIERGLDV